MTKPDFSGTWQFIRDQSLLEIPAPDLTVFVIDHDEPCFCLTRTHVVNGKSDTFSVELTTDGKIVEFIHNGVTVRASLKWEANALMFAARLNRAGEHATNIVRYELSANEQVFFAHEWFRSKSVNYDNRWVFQRVKT